VEAECLSRASAISEQLPTSELLHTHHPSPLYTTTSQFGDEKRVQNDPIAISLEDSHHFPHSKSISIELGISPCLSPFWSVVATLISPLHN